MWNAWGVTWGDSWGTSWGPLHEVEEFRRPKSTAAVRLVKIKEGRSWLAHSRVGTTARMVRAVGAQPPAPVVLPGHARLAPSRTGTRVAGVRAAAGGSSRALGARACSFGFSLGATGTAAARLRSATAITLGVSATSSGASRVGVRSATAATSCDRVAARGARGLSSIDIAAVLVAVDRRR